MNGNGTGPPAAASRAKGALLALAAGDALGWPQEMPRNLRSPRPQQPHIEFQAWVRRSGGRFRPYEESIDPGEYSDDTQLTLAVAHARTRYADSWWKALTRIELPLWTIYQRGAGGATRRAASAWARGHPPWKTARADQIRRYFDAGGNGVAMRVLPHAILLRQVDDPTVLVRDVVLDGLATHGHPRALLGATAYAYAAWLLMRRTSTLGFGELIDALVDNVPQWGGAPDLDRRQGSWLQAANEALSIPYLEIWDRTIKEMVRLLEDARQGIRAGALADDHAVLRDLGCFGSAKGAGTTSTAAAVYLATRHAAQPVQGVLRAAFEKGADTDTLAAMVGGLAGSLAGEEWLPTHWLHVQDAGYIRSLARRLTEVPDNRPHKEIHAFQNATALVTRIAEVEDGREIDFADRKVTVKRMPNPRPIAKSISVRAWRLRTVDGQTFQTVKIQNDKRTVANPRRRASREDLRAHDKGTGAPMQACDPGELYAVFRRQLEVLLGRSNTLKTKEIQEALGIVQSQAEKWLSRAQKEGWLLQTSKKPKAYALNLLQIQDRSAPSR